MRGADIFGGGDGGEGFDDVLHRVDGAQGGAEHQVELTLVGEEGRADEADT